MRERFPNPQTDPVDAMAWGMATTGMGQKEYWGRWSVKADRIHIEGTKRAGRVRDVPLILRPAVPSMHRRTFENKLRARDRGFTPYNLRRTYANWLETAGVPRTRRRLYMGHGAADVTDLYEMHEVRAFLADDAIRLRQLLGIDARALLEAIR
jgi:integrase